MKRIVTIAGSDCGGGAGIQADLRAITMLGAYGMSAVTAVTVQDGSRVEVSQALPAELVAAQARMALDLGADAVKTGMLASGEIVEAVVGALLARRPPVVVVDPVIAASDGAPLLDEDGRRLLRERLLPLASLATPNIPEAEWLSGLPIASAADMERAAQRICALGPAAVVITGGHLDGEPLDVLYEAGQQRTSILVAQRRRFRGAHGSGCTFSAAVATLLADGQSLTMAVTEAKRLTEMALQAAVPLGGGSATNALGWAGDFDVRRAVLDSLQDAYEQLARYDLGELVPEVRSNLGYALPDALTPDDVAAFPGRLTTLDDRLVALRRPAFGASGHIARVILTAMRHYPELRAAINIRHSQRLLAAATAAGLRIAEFDRRHEPAEVGGVEGRSLSWGVDAALSGCQSPPDLIVDGGGPGKEPMIRILASHPAEVVAKLRAIVAALQASADGEEVHQ